MIHAVAASTTSHIRMGDAFQKRPVNLNIAIARAADGCGGIPARATVVRLTVSMPIHHDEQRHHSMGPIHETALVQSPVRAPIHTDNDIVSVQVGPVGQVP